MPVLFFYSLKVSICLGGIYLFYHLALRNLTFYNWNRWFLLIGSGFCFLIPLIADLPFLETRKIPDLRMIPVLPALNTFSGPVFYPSDATSSFGEYLSRFVNILFGLGVLIQGSRLVIQFASFFRLRRSATLLLHGLAKIYQVDKKIAPFSFGNAIFLNKNLLQPTELPEIIRHELVHIHQKHTFDVIWMEFLLLFNWYNPFVWLLKRAVRQNLEFIADRVVLIDPSVDKKYYQYLLLKVIGLPDFRIAHQFNISSLKTRIKMMNKMPSSKLELVKFVFVLPIMALLVLACQDDLSLAETSKAEAMQNVSPPPPPPVPTEPDPQEESFSDADFLKRNPTVFYITPVFRNNNYKSVKVVLKSGKEEVYNLDDKKELAQFRKRYGYYPLNVKNLPPPPPPVVSKVSAEYIALIKRNSQIESVGWQGDNTMVVFLKSGEREEYDLNNPTSKANAEKKYGKLPKKPL